MVCSWRPLQRPISVRFVRRRLAGDQADRPRAGLQLLAAVLRRAVNGFSVDCMLIEKWRIMRQRSQRLPQQSSRVPQSRPRVTWSRRHALAVAAAGFTARTLI